MSLSDYLFKDKKGKLAVAQPPNLWLVLFFILLAAQGVVAHGSAHRVLAAMAFGVIFYWSVTEFLSGDSRFRRLLGLLVLVIAVLIKAA